MKKIACILLSCVLLIVTIPLGVASAPLTAITVSSVSANRGDVVDVKVNISSGSGMQACDFELWYDSDVLEVVTAVKGSCLTSSPIINTSILGKIVFSYAATNILTGGGVVLNIQFKVKATAPYGKSILELNCKDLSDGDFNDIANSVKNGYIEVMAPKLEAPYSVETSKTTDTTISIYWSDIDEATGYNIYLDSVLINTDPVPENTYELVGLSPDTEYLLQITSMHYTVESNKSEEFVIRTAAEEQIIYLFYLVEGADGTLNYEYVSTPIIDGSIESIPEIPSVEGYIFEGWDQDLSSLQAGAMVWAKYQLITSTVTFVDWDGTILSTQTVAYGDAAEAPEVPTRQGYSFSSWDKTFSVVKEDMTVTAQYIEVACDHKNVVSRDSVESTCTTKGYSGYIVCLDCDSVIMTGSELPLAAHKYEAVVTEPTPSSQGYTTHTCGVCGDSYTDSYVDYVDENAPQIVVGAKRTAAGKTVDVTISLKNNPGLVSATLRVAYDTNVLTLVRVTDAGTLGTTSHKPEFSEPYTLAWVNDTATSNYTYNGKIVTLTFEVAEDAALGKYPITVSYDYDNYDIYNADAEKIKFATVNGYVEVLDVILGDVNSDGVVNNLDRMILTRYLADWEEYGEESINLVAADVNGDGLVNNLDRMILTRHLADWDGYQELPYVG